MATSNSQFLALIGCVFRRTITNTSATRVLASAYPAVTYATIFADNSYLSVVVVVPLFVEFVVEFKSVLIENPRGLRAFCCPMLSAQIRSVVYGFNWRTKPPVNYKSHNTTNSASSFEK